MTRGEEDNDISNISAEWQKEYSKTHKRNYWFNSSTGSTSWEDPLINPQLKRRRINEESDTSKTNVQEGQRSGAKTCNGTVQRNYDIAIIVPYRDLHKEQRRRQQLDVFIPSISKFMDEKNNQAMSYKMYVVEQSDDNRKFNRGKLLNIGFSIAKLEGCKAFIFHDVDLLPSSKLQEFYYKIPSDKPIHIARVWNRYSANQGYFGGITSFSDSLFNRINGFPNNFWGWGGEDDELYNRTKKVRIVYIFNMSIYILNVYIEIRTQ
jgi:hypothetical protein